MKYYVISKNDNIEYVIKIKEKDNGVIKYSMFRSKADCWSESARGEKLMTVVDKDFQIKIDFEDNNLEMPYHTAMELRILLNFINDRSYSPDEYKVIKEK